MMTIEHEAQHTSFEDYLTKQSCTLYSWPDDAWQRSFLPVGTANRLARIDRAVQGANTILRILRRTSHVPSDHHDQSTNVSHQSRNEVDGLYFALGVLQDSMTDAIEQLRDNQNNCCRGTPANVCASSSIGTDKNSA